MDDSQHVEDAVLGVNVVHDPRVADSKSMERVGCSLDGPYLLAADPPGRCGRRGKLLEASLDPCLGWTRQLAKGGGRRG